MGRPFLQKTFRLLQLLLIAFAVFIFGLYALLYFFQEKLLFAPEVLPPRSIFPFGPMTQERTWEVEPGVTLHALYFHKSQSKGLVLYFHGNAGSLMSWGFAAENYVNRGYDVLMPDYRGYGKSTGFVRSQKTLLKDALFLYGEAQKLVPPEKIVLVGQSLGSGLAAYCARQNSPRQLILISPYHSLKDALRFHFPWVPTFLLRYPLPTHAWLKEVKCPIALLHGTEDNVIPFTSGEKLARTLKGPHRFYPLPGLSHNDINDSPAFESALDEIFSPRTNDSSPH